MDKAVAYDAIDEIVSRYQCDMLSPEQALSEIAAVLADTESGVEV